MKHRRLLLSLVLLVALALASAGRVVWVTRSEDRVSQDKVRKIRKGMPRQDAEQILGQPAGEAGAHREGKVTILCWYPRPRKEWYDKLEFDEQKRVVKIEENVNIPTCETLTESLLAKIRRWLGL